MRRQLRKVSTSASVATAATSIAAIPTAPSVTAAAIQIERRSSSNSESSIEPMDISSSNNRTTSTEANSSVALKISDRNDSDNIIAEESENEDDEDGNEYPSHNVVRRDNLRHLDNNVIMRKKINRFNSSNNNINNNNVQYNNYDKQNMIISGQDGRTDDINRRTSSDSSIDGKLSMESKKYFCPICSSVLDTQHEFTEHIRSHNNSDDSQNFTCRICSKVLSSASSLDRHVLVHTGERPFTCKYCHVTFTTNGNMHRHMRTHKQREGENYESDGSTDSSASSNNNNYHNRLDGKRKIIDDESTNHLKRKIRTINNNNIINSNTTKTVPQLQKFCCPVCIRNDFSSMVTLENHMDKEHPTIPAKCRHCEVVFKSHKALNAHRCSINSKSQNITQGFKDLTFVDFSSEKFPLIAKSVCEQSIRTPIASQKFECPKCFRAFPCASSVDIHMKDCGMIDSPQDFSIRRRQTSETSEEDARRDDFFANLDLQNKSMVMNTTTTNTTTNSSGPMSPQSPPLQDDEPSSPIDSKIGILKTSSMHHQDSKDLADIESIINVTSSSGFLRQFDRSTMVTTPSSKSNPDLNSSFYSNKDDEEAQDAFTAEFRKMKLRGEFPCKLCTAIFPNLRALKGHNRVHLSSAGAGPYRCNMCPYSIHDKAALIRHMRTHNGDRPYECAICNYAFTTKANCERHLRNRHAKSTRDEVKRAIIYHPSEDSSCDDPSKKLQMFNSSDFGDEDEHIPKDRSTPVSHLKEMLLPTVIMPSSPAMEKPVKIQVKSLEKLIQPNSFEETKIKRETPSIPETGKPMDLSMDALDLSKKSNKITADDKETSESPPPIPKIDFSFLEKNQQLLFAQQQLLSESIPKIDPAHYFQLSQLYRNFMFPPAGLSLQHFFLQNSLFAQQQQQHQQQNNQPTEIKDFLRGPQMSGGSLVINPLFPSSASSPPPILQMAQQQQPTQKEQPQQLNKSLNSSIISQTQSQNQPNPTHSPGPVKMVIKNGVLMPKQKQRRYRTERPFACEHCSARFTLRSNMERHIKQQHPQFWAQRQRSGHSIMRRGGGGNSSNGGSGTNNNNNTSANHIVSPIGPTIANNSFGAISDQVKYAILAQQLKGRDNSKLPFLSSQIHAMNNNNSTTTTNQNQNQNVDNEQQHQQQSQIDEEEEDPQLVIDEDSQPEDLSQLNNSKIIDSVNDERKIAAKKIADNILEQAIKVKSASVTPTLTEAKDFDLKIAPNLITKAESVGKYLREMSAIKEEADLVSVSKLVDNATNAMTFGNYFRSDPNPTEHSDEEGLVASGSASESNNSGTEDPNPPPATQHKKKSAYSLAPNRVSCPYCQRMFPWSSSLRRHILTHTGQKPFKCSHCPLLFTTKSNCDRHLLRKHGNVESAVSLYVPIEDIPEPTKKEIINIPEEQSPVQQLPIDTTTPTINVPQLKIGDGVNPTISSDLPFKCHLCDGSFPERLNCLEHIKNIHTQEFALLMAKGAIETDVDALTASAEDEDRAESKGKYPDYANRKVICAFCMRRFWSTEDLRRHMRTHSGERPFQCDICLRKFTLKHSMLRHQKKHNIHGNNQQNSVNSASDVSDDESSSTLVPSHSTISNLANLPNLLKIPEIIAKEWKSQQNRYKNDDKNGDTGSGNGKENILEKLQATSTSDGGILGMLMKQEHHSEDASDLIGNLLGISDQGILNKVLQSSPDEAAKLLGVEK